MNRLTLHPTNLRQNMRPRIKRCILQRLDHPRRIPRIRPCPPRNAPQRTRQFLLRWRHKRARNSRRINLQRQPKCLAVTPRHIIEYLTPRRPRRARPMPGGEILSQRAISIIRIKISPPRPRKRWVPEIHLNPCLRRNRPPSMPPRCIQHKALRLNCSRRQFDRPAQPPRNRRANFFHLRNQTPAVPTQRAWPNLQQIRRPPNRPASPLRHSPARRRTIQRNIHRAKIFRLSRRFRPRIIRRKHAADKGNQRHRVLSIIAYRIDIPPGISTRNDVPAEPKSVSSRVAARRPEIAAIGSPGPG